MRDTVSLAEALAELVTRLGPPGVLCFSPLPDVDRIGPVAETSAADLEVALGLSIVGAAAAVRAVMPAMRQSRHGTLLFTAGGAALHPSADRAASGVVYTAQTAYVRMLHDALADAGPHVAQTVIVGPVGPGLQHEPADVAEHPWQRHQRRDEVLTVID